MFKRVFQLLALIVPAPFPVRPSRLSPRPLAGSPLDTARLSQGRGREAGADHLEDVREMVRAGAVSG